MLRLPLKHDEYTPASQEKKGRLPKAVMAAGGGTFDLVDVLAEFHLGEHRPDHSEHSLNALHRLLQEVP